MKIPLETFPQFLQREPVPDLQALAAEWGGLGNVPDEVMERFEAARTSWNIRRLFRGFL